MRSPGRNRRGAWKLMPVLVPISVALVVLQGCGDDDHDQPGNPPGEEIRVLEPQAGATVGSHSVLFSVTLGEGVDPDGLKVALNGQDMTAHLRLDGNQATGYVYGMREGSNALSFTAPVPGHGTANAEVRFTFAPRPIESVEAARTCRVAGLQGIVDVLTDPWGVPHIYTMGDNPDDLAFMQGYVTAKQRLFQIDLFRKVAQGRLTELLGTLLDRSVLENDLMFRTLFLTYERGRVEHIDQVLAEDLQARNPEIYAYLLRYVDGVNAYIGDLKAGRNGAVMPQQYQLLNLLGPYEIEPITIPQLFSIGRLQQFLLSETMFEEIDRQLNWESVLQSERAGAIPAGTRQDLYRAAPPNPATILQPGEPGYVGPAAESRGLFRAAVAAGGSGAARLRKVHLQALRGLGDRLARVRSLILGGMERPGSNNWILSPSMTDSGFAILCNDPHLSLDNPSVFHPVHGDNKSFSHGRLNYSGCTFPGVPGLMLGQNERIAWGGTVANYDVTDLYEEDVHIGGGSKTVSFQGGLVPVETIYETFHIRGGDSQFGGEAVIPIDYVPHHGPQVPGDPYSPGPGLTPENNLTIRWTGNFLTRDFDAFHGLLLARDMDEFLAALENFGVGAQNWVGADVNGEIAYFPHALIPVRPPAALTEEHPPYLPYPGTGGFEWLAGDDGRPLFLPSGQVPHVRNPERGWLVTANNDITGGTLDNDPLNDGLYLGYNLNVGFRNGRISDLLLALEKEERDLDHMEEIQADHVTLLGKRLRPFLLEALASEEALGGLAPDRRDRIGEAAGYLSSWDLRCETGVPDPFTDEQPLPEDVDSSIGASLFFAWLNRAIEATFGDELDEAGARLSSGNKIRGLVHILEDTAEPEDSPFHVHTLGPDGQSLLWDDIRTTDLEESRDEILVHAMNQALDDLEDLMGTSDMAQWRWGKIHTLTFRLQGIGSAVLAYNLPSYSLLDQLLGADTKGYPRPGGWQTVDPADHRLSGLDFSTGHGPAMRMVVELEEGVMRARNVLPGGANDLQAGTGLLHPVRIRSDIHYGDQIPLWLANEYRPQFIFWEDVTQVAESRVRFEPE